MLMIRPKGRGGKQTVYMREMAGQRRYLLSLCKGTGARNILEYLELGMRSERKEQ